MNICWPLQTGMFIQFESVVLYWVEFCLDLCKHIGNPLFTNGLGSELSLFVMGIRWFMLTEVKDTKKLKFKKTLVSLET